MRLEGPSDTELMFRGWRVTTADIAYHRPDHPHILQSFVWQKLDLPPRFPRLREFLDFWSRELEGPLHSIRVMHGALLRPADYRFIDRELRLD